MLTCTTRVDSPLSPVDRFKDAKELRNTDKYKLEYDQNVATLTIRRTENMDAGRYRLEAHNVNGDAQTACRLNVSGRYTTVCSQVLIHTAE